MDKLASKNNKIKIILVAVDDFLRLVKFETMINNETMKNMLKKFYKFSQKKISRKKNS